MTTRAAHAETVRQAREAVFRAFGPTPGRTQAVYDALDAFARAVRHEAGADRLPRQAQEVRHAWQLIDSAPKDGTSILIAHEIHNLPCVDFAWYTTDSTGPHWRNYEGDHLFPTHWQLLPSHPRQSADALLLLSDHPHEDGADTDQAQEGVCESLRELLLLVNDPTFLPSHGEILEIKARAKAALAQVGYRGNPSVSEAGRSAQSASAIQHPQIAPPEDEQTDQARSGHHATSKPDRE